MVGGDAARGIILDILSRGDAGRKGNEASTALLAGIESERTRCRLLQERLDEMRKQHGEASKQSPPHSLCSIPSRPVPSHPVWSRPVPSYPVAGMIHQASRPSAQKGRG
jgi:hypothetical protein